MHTGASRLCSTDVVQKRTSRNCYAFWVLCSRGIVPDGHRSRATIQSLLFSLYSVSSCISENPWTDGLSKDGDYVYSDHRAAGFS